MIYLLKDQQKIKFFNYLKKNNKTLFNFNEQTNRFYCDRLIIKYILSKFNLNDIQTDILVKGMVQKYLNIKVNTLSDMIYYD